jgi:succinate dehydrogenase / fumarate reductase membrane anchor subunit
MVNTRSTPKPREGAFLWLFKIVAGILIVVLLGLHFLVNHLFAPQGLLSHAEVITYYQNPIIPAVEILFLVTVIAHSLVGLRSIILDLNPSERVLKILDILFWLAGIGFSIYGIWLALTIAQMGG